MLTRERFEFAFGVPVLSLYLHVKLSSHSEDAQCFNSISEPSSENMKTLEKYFSNISYMRTRLLSDFQTPRKTWR